VAIRDPEQYRLHEAEHQQIFDTQIRRRLFEGATPSDKPVAVIFGGQPGAGKSASLAFAALELAGRGGAVKIVGDELRDFHPMYARLLKTDDQVAAFFTDRDSGRWVEKAIEFALAQRCNVVIEGTYRDPDVVASTMAKFRAAGYEIDARALAVNERFSAQGILHRYEEQRSDMGHGRMTTPKAHTVAYEGMPLTLKRIEDEALADRLTLYRRGGQAIYSNELIEGQWKHEPAAVLALEQERSRAWTLDERQAFLATADRIDALLKAPGRNATSADFERAEAMRRQADPPLSAAISAGRSPYTLGKEQERARAVGMAPPAQRQQSQISSPAVAQPPPAPAKGPRRNRPL
jgi:hypothetical protein